MKIKIDVQNSIVTIATLTDDTIRF